MKKRLQVAVAIIVNNDEQVLIARRHAHQHQGDLWEFPGGKREADETRLEALQRAEPLMQIVHDYPDLQVELDVWLVTEFSGEATGKEGQPLVWCPLAELPAKEFPAANMQIIERLTNLYFV